MTRRRVWIPVVAAALVVAVVAVVLFVRRGPGPAGPELARNDGSYGWSGSFAVGDTFTDGLNLITVTDKATGPLTLISAKSLNAKGDSLELLGERARVIPDMLPAGYQTGWFQHVPGFPPTSGDAAGGVPVEGLVVQPSKPGEDRWIEIQVGYRVKAPGRYVRAGVEVVYSYGGKTFRTVIPSHVAICAPAPVACPDV
jgi:hypothetical protein